MINENRSEKDTVTVAIIEAVIMPPFRYAVGPTSQHSPAIPHYTRKEAEVCFADMVRLLPWDGAIIYKRTRHGLVKVREYIPNSTPSSGNV